MYLREEEEGDIVEGIVDRIDPSDLKGNAEVSFSNFRRVFFFFFLFEGEGGGWGGRSGVREVIIEDGWSTGTFITKKKKKKRARKRKKKKGLLLGNFR